MSNPDMFLKIRCAYIVYMMGFSLSINYGISRAQSIEKLRSKGLNAEWNPSDSKNFEVAESFLLPQFIKESFRIKSDDFVVRLARNSDRDSREILIPVSTYLTIYPELNTGILLLSLKIEDLTTDDLIFLTQCLEGRFEVGVTFPSVLDMNHQSGRISPRKVFEKYIELVSKSLGSPAVELRVFTAWCMEIQDVGAAIKTPERLVEQFPKQMYGLAYTDEGWRFVPKKVAISGLSNRWGTRDFLTVIPFGFNGIVVLNFHHGMIHKEYVQSQKQLREQYQQQVEEYFTFSPEIAGLNHGPLLLLENSLVQYVLLEHSLELLEKETPRRIKDFLRMRDHLINTLAKLSRIQNPQINLLGKRLEESLRIEKSKEEIRKKIEEIESVLVLKYNQRIDLWVIILASSSLIIGVLSILIQLGFLNQIIKGL